MQVLSNPELRERYDKHGEQALDVDLMDSAEFFTMLFGSDRCGPCGPIICIFHFRRSRAREALSWHVRLHSDGCSHLVAEVAGITVCVYRFEYLLGELSITFMARCNGDFSPTKMRQLQACLPCLVPKRLRACLSMLMSLLKLVGCPAHRQAQTATMPLHLPGSCTLGAVAASAMNAYPSRLVRSAMLLRLRL